MLKDLEREVHSSIFHDHITQHGSFGAKIGSTIKELNPIAFWKATFIFKSSLPKIVNWLQFEMNATPTNITSKFQA